MKQPIIMDGRVLAKEIEEDLSARTRRIIEKTDRVPVLATILVGDNPASVTYVRMKGNACKRVGIDSLRVELPGSTTTEELLAKIEELNADENVCAYCCSIPYPARLTSSGASTPSRWTRTRTA